MNNFSEDPAVFRIVNLSSSIHDPHISAPPEHIDLLAQGLHATLS